MPNETFTLNVRLNGAAFEWPMTELARILREIAGRLEEEGADSGAIRDSNGNSCGGFGFQVSED